MKVYPELKSASCIKKHSSPILTSADMPFDSSLVFNAGVTKIDGKYVMFFRNDYGAKEEDYKDPNGKRISGLSVGVAVSDNGIDGWRVHDKLLIDNKDMKGQEITSIYDPRVTVIDGKIYLCLAVHTRHGILGGIAEVNDTLDGFKLLSTTVPDNRNMVLFPEKINGKFMRLERPFPVYSRGHKDRFDIWSGMSPDLIYWGEHKLVLAVENVPFCNDKLGPAAPPIKTEKGWLATFHSVDVDPSRGKNGWADKWDKRYCGGLMLLDLEEPSKVIGMYKEPLLAPELPFEVEGGYRDNVIFPGGMVLEPDGEVKIYYGASDTVEAVARADVNDLLALCTSPRI